MRVCIYIYIYVYIYIYAHIYTYIYIYTHTYIHTCTHTQLYISTCIVQGISHVISTYTRHAHNMYHCIPDTSQCMYSCIHRNVYVKTFQIMYQRTGVCINVLQGCINTFMYIYIYICVPKGIDHCISKYSRKAQGKYHGIPQLYQYVFLNIQLYISRYVIIYANITGY